MRKSYRAMMIKVAFLIIYLIVLLKYPITTVVVSIILVALCRDIMSDSETGRWIDGYTKKDGTYVSGHRRRKKN